MAKRKLKHILQGLKQYYSEPLTTSFKQFRAGLMYFTFGFILFYLANQTIPPSLKQEIITLISIGFIGLGFFMAALAHIKMIISRIVTFFTKK